MTVMDSLNESDRFGLCDDDRDILMELAIAHGIDRVSSLTAAQIGKALGRDNGIGLGGRLRRLEQKGLIEDVSTSDGKAGTARWRLPGAKYVAPFYADEAL